MSDNISFEIQAQIMKRLPAKKLIQCKKVSKQWKSLIESSLFMTDYNLSKTGPNHLFIRYDKEYNADKQHVSILDDNETFPQHRFVHTLPDALKPLYGRFDEPRIVGSSHGLFCLYGYTIRFDKSIIIWNPSINKYVALDDVHFDAMSKIGFGVRPDTLDPMIVKIDNKLRCEVFSLSTGVWTNRRIDLPRESIIFTVYQVDVNGFIYWIIYDKSGSAIVSFDTRSEKFSEVNIPKCLESSSFSISKLSESLVVLEDYKEAETLKNVCVVWMMIEDGVQKSFTKLYTIRTQDVLFSVLGFSNCGKPIVGTTKVDDFEAGVLLSVYDPHSENTDGIAIHKLCSSLTLFVSSYTETLLLLDHSGKPIPYRSRNIH